LYLANEAGGEDPHEVGRVMIKQETFRELLPIGFHLMSGGVTPEVSERRWSHRTVERRERQSEEGEGEGETQLGRDFSCLFDNCLHASQHLVKLALENDLTLLKNDN